MAIKSIIFCIIFIKISVSLSNGNLTEVFAPERDILNHFNNLIKELCKNDSCSLQINSFEEPQNKIFSDLNDELLKTIGGKYPVTMNAEPKIRSMGSNYLVVIMNEVDNVT